MNVNPLLIMVLIYIAFFGINIKLDEGAPEVTNLSKCKPIPAPTLQVPPTLPIIDKANLENKDYIIRLLIKHAREQNVFIDGSNKEVTKIYNAYTECVVR